MNDGKEIEYSFYKCRYCGKGFLLVKGNKNNTIKKNENSWCGKCNKHK